MYARLIKKIRRIFQTNRKEIPRPDLKRLREYRRELHKEYTRIWRLYVDERRCISDERFAPREKILNRVEDSIDEILKR